MNSKERGELGEQYACSYLMGNGYKILDRNFHSRFGEIDIVAADSKYIVFVEVKLRKNDMYGKACEAVSPAKQRKIISTALIWLEYKRCKLQPRFDVIEVYSTEEGAPPSINHIIDAFE